MILPQVSLLFFLPPPPPPLFFLFSLSLFSFSYSPPFHFPHHKKKIITPCTIEGGQEEDRVVEELKMLFTQMQCSNKRFATPYRLTSVLRLQEDVCFVLFCILYLFCAFYIIFII